MSSDRVRRFPTLSESGGTSSQLSGTTLASRSVSDNSSNAIQDGSEYYDGTSLSHGEGSTNESSTISSTQGGSVYNGTMSYDLAGSNLRQLSISYGNTINNTSNTSNPTSSENDVFPLFERVLFPADNAQFNGKGSPDDVCHEKTRLEIRKKIENWIVEGKEHVFWLNGLAGTGKSTIARTIARDHYNKFDKVPTAWTATFFFSKGKNDINHTEKFVSSIAVQLARRHKDFETQLNHALRRDAGIPTKSLVYQWDDLILGPLSKLKKGSEIDILVVIDALDECRNEEAEKIYGIITKSPMGLENDGICLRFFVTSRRKVTISSIGEELQCHHDLSALPIGEVNEDIRMYLESTLEGYDLDETRIRALVDTADGLFICAATAGLHIKGIDKLDCHDRVNEILANLSESDVGKKLDKIYSTVLKSSIFGTSDSEEKRRALCAKRRALLSNLALLVSPLCLEPLSRLLGQDLQELRAFIEHYSSILHLPEDDFLPFRLHHSCFYDFLFDEKRSQISGFHVRHDEAQSQMLDHCLRVMEGEKSSGHGVQVHGWESCRVSLNHDDVNHASPKPEIQYACRYWVYHLEKSRNLDSGVNKVWPFLETNLLNWLEAMSVFRLFSEAILAVKKLQLFFSRCPAGSTTTSILKFLDDASRFALKNRKLAEIAPLNLISSGILFCPKSSVLRERFETRFPSTRMMSLRGVEETWNAELLTLESHTHLITSVASSSCTGIPLLASCSRDCSVKLWNPNTGDLLWSNKAHSIKVNSVAFSCGNKLSLASGASDNTIILWDCISGKPFKTLKGHDSHVNSVAFAPISGTQILASGSDDKTVRIWDCSTYEQNTTLLHSHGVKSVSFSHDGSLLASAANKYVIVWDWRTGTAVHTFKDHRSRVISLAFAPSAHTPILASGSADKTMNIWNCSTYEKVHTLSHPGVVSGITFLPSPEANLLASASQGGSIQVWDYIAGELRLTLNGHSTHTSSVAVFSSPNATSIICGADRELIRLWDLSIVGLDQSSSKLEGRFDEIAALEFSPDGNILASLSQSFDFENVKIWDPTTGHVVKVLQGHSDQVMSIAFAPDPLNQLLASGSSDRSIKLWNPTYTDQSEDLGCHSDAITSIVFSSDNKLLASGSHDGTLKTWLLSHRRHHKAFPVQPGPVVSLLFSPDSKRLVSLHHEGNIVVWDCINGTIMHIIPNHTDEIFSINLSPDGKLLAFCSSNENVQIRDLETGKLRKSLVNDNAWAAAVAFSPDGRLLAADSGSCGRLTTIWKTESYEPLTLTGHSGLIWSENCHYITIEDRQWLCFDGERMIWLPIEYRKTCLALKNGVLALSNSRGQVSFVDISGAK